MSKYKSNENLGKPVTVLTENSNSGKIVAIYKDQFIIAPTDKIIYEPEIKELLGVPQTEKLLCLYEKTCGAIMYTEHNSERKYLLIKNESGHIGFPKGHIELNETEEETALREVFEETGFVITLTQNFRTKYQYVTLENTQKDCVYFLAHYDYSPAKIQESEISQSWLVTYDEAMQLLNFVQDREILTEAENMLRR